MSFIFITLHADLIRYIQCMLHMREAHMIRFNERIVSCDVNTEAID
jgi:hypothetical protein